MGLYLLVYDAGCGPCTKFKRMIDWLDKYNRLEYVSLADADERGFLNPIPEIQRHRSFHLISPMGEILSGSAAIPKLLSLLPLGGISVTVIQKVPGGRSLVNFVYSTFSRLHDTGSCSYRSSSTSQSTDLESLGGLRIENDAFEHAIRSGIV